jgi:hypothetical protein
VLTVIGETEGQIWAHPQLSATCVDFNRFVEHVKGGIKGGGGSNPKPTARAFAASYKAERLRRWTSLVDAAQACCALYFCGAAADLSTCGSWLLWLAGAVTCCVHCACGAAVPFSLVVVRVLHKAYKSCCTYGCFGSCCLMHCMNPHHKMYCSSTHGGTCTSTCLLPFGLQD